MSGLTAAESFLKSILDLCKKNISNWSKIPDLVSGRIPVDGSGVKQPTTPSNIDNKFREAFESYTPGTKWTQVLGSGDIIALDGNTAASSYLVISKNPLNVGESSIETIDTWDMPFDAAVGLSLSQRTLGQEFSVELVSNETPITPASDLTISAIQQSTTTLTVTTTTNHNLRIGMRIGIRNCADSRMNYSSLVVATTPTPTQFTVTAGPGGTIPSVTAGPFASGFVFYRSALGYAPNGTSQIFENATVTNASFYVRSESGDVLPSGTIVSNHSVTVATTASVQAVNALGAYAFQPTNEYRLTQFIDGIQWSDIAIDAISASSNRLKRTQVVPDIAHNYKFRIRAVNQPSLSRPVAQIVSAVKSGTTTATITTDVAHGLSTSDFVNVYGIRDQAASSFPNLLVATAVASIVSPTVFTVVIGTAASVTSYGGFVARVNGGTLMSTLGANAIVASTVARTSNIVTLVGSGSWAGLLIGDYINIVGIRDNSTGATIGIDGAYRVRDIVTTNLILEPIGSTPTGADITTTNCGGGVIKRTDMRISYVRAMNFERQRVEMLERPTGDVSKSVSAQITNALPTGANTIGSANVLGQAAHSAAATGNPVRTGGKVVPLTPATIDTTLVASDTADSPITPANQNVSKNFGPSELDFSFNFSCLASVVTVQQLIPASGTASVRNNLTNLILSTDTLGAGGVAWILDGALTVSSIATGTGLCTTSAAHDLKVGDSVVFTALTGGTGVSTNTVYYVTSVGSTTTFNFALTIGGANVVPTVAATAGTCYRILYQQHFKTTGIPQSISISFPNPIRNNGNVPINFLIPVSMVTGTIYISSSGYRGV